MHEQLWRRTGVARGNVVSPTSGRSLLKGAIVDALGTKGARQSQRHAKHLLSAPHTCTGRTHVERRGREVEDLGPPPAKSPKWRLVRRRPLSEVLWCERHWASTRPQSALPHEIGEWSMHQSVLHSQHKARVRTRTRACLTRAHPPGVSLTDSLTQVACARNTQCQAARHESLCTACAAVSQTRWRAHLRGPALLAASPAQPVSESGKYLQNWSRYPRP